MIAAAARRISFPAAGLGFEPFPPGAYIMRAHYSMENFL
jgi:hypothetical protein